jgi:hypothetical protein
MGNEASGVDKVGELGYLRDYQLQNDCAPRGSIHFFLARGLKGPGFIPGTGSRAHLASYPMDAVNSFRGLSGQIVKLTTHLNLKPRPRKVEFYLHSPMPDAYYPDICLDVLSKTTQKLRHVPVETRTIHLHNANIKPCR